MRPYSKSPHSLKLFLDYLLYSFDFSICAVLATRRQFTYLINIIWWLNRGGDSGNSVRFFWGGSKITADGYCSHEIKRCLLLGRKVMTNLDSIVKSKDITLSTNVRLVKAMVFPSHVWKWVGLWRKLSAEKLMLLNWCWSGVGEDSWESLTLQGDPTSPS